MNNAYNKAVYCHPAYLTYMRSTSGKNESQAGIKIAGKNINNLKYADDTTSIAGSEEKQKNILNEGERRDLKCCLKTQHPKY